MLYVLGEVIFTGFYGADGYSIIIEYKNLQIIYGHVSPNFLVKKNNIIKKNEKIGTVGPKYIEAEENNKYFDSSHKKTNGATTGCHLHITIKKDGIAVNPLDYL
jgi:murein DD-endopeptidase MepM/ murein hydrolase activator NlpD